MRTAESAGSSDVDREDQEVQLSTAMRMSGPRGASTAYCEYLALNAESARGPSSESTDTSVAAPSIRTHHSADQSSSYRSTSMLTRGFDSIFASRRSDRVDFGLASTAVHTTSPTRAKTTGTRCGPPVEAVVASRPTRVVSKRSRAHWCTLQP